MRLMLDNIELPIKKAWYNCLNWQAAAGVVANNNTYCDNWYLTNSINICCEKQFFNKLKEYSPRIVVDNTHPWSVPLINTYEFPKSFLKYSITLLIIFYYFLNMNKLDSLIHKLIVRLHL